ncbi:hypothetical protein ACIPPJ_19510 [Streptomyces sp. NPDC086091]|uniref:hypothetical protein n=1 Tax=Streptomyces sp. NPDC086091 TaxID=3365751 RepID=UPI0037F14C18
MSYGEPHNPYGPPPQQPQPAPGHPPQGYGFPPQGPPQQGYPQYPGGPAPYPQYQGGYPGGPSTLPGAARTARILTGVIALAHVIVAGAYLWVLGRWDEEMAKAGVTGDADAERFADIGKGVVVFLAALATVYAVLGLILVLQYAKGGNGVRVCSIVYASFAIVTGIFSLTAWGLGLLLIGVSITAIVFAAKRETADWFRRPRF